MSGIANILSGIIFLAYSVYSIIALRQIKNKYFNELSSFVKSYVTNNMTINIGICIYSIGLILYGFYQVNKNKKKNKNNVETGDATSYT